MELNEKQIELVGLYLQGRLKGVERSNFLSEVEADSLLKDELKIQQSILDGIEHQNNKELRTRFKKIATEIKETPKDTKIIPMRFVKWAASVAAVAVLCFAAYFLIQSPSSSQSLYAQYFEPSELTITRSTDVKAELMELKEFYNTKKYDKALPLFNKAVTADPTSSNLRLAYGNTLLKCNKVAKARAEFDYIIEANDPLYSDQARWFLGLLELKKGDIQNAKKNLNILVEDTRSDFHAEAKSLLEELKNL